MMAFRCLTGTEGKALATLSTSKRFNRYVAPHHILVKRHLCQIIAWSSMVCKYSLNKPQSVSFLQ